MLKTIRKHNKWLMAGFGVLLMVTWLVQPALNQINAAQRSRVVAKLDGKRITIGKFNDASGEAIAVTKLLPGLSQQLGLEEQDNTVHWLMLVSEAEAAGLVGGPQDGEDWTAPMTSLVYSLAYRSFGQNAQEILRNPQYQQLTQQFADQAKQMLPRLINSIEADRRMMPSQVYTALAKARGIDRLVSGYRSAARMSDRATVVKAREYLDAAKTDYVFVPSERLIDAIPAPDAAALQAHFDKYKTVKPGDGDYGVGYLLPARVKLEWMKLDRTAIESAVTLDAVEVRKRYKQGHDGAIKKYAGEFADERSNIERDMKNEVVDKAIGEAQIAIQTEIIKATRSLDEDGKYKKLPAGWEQTRPKFEAVAQAVVEAVKRQTGLTIPLPAITVKAADWMTRTDLQALPEIGRSQLRQGGTQIPFDQVIFWTREIPGAEEGLIPVQVNLPLAETYFTDFAQNRYYICVLATKGESAPDSIDEKHDQIVKDYKSILAFEQLKGRAEELRTKAIAGGLDAIVAAFPAADAPKPEKSDGPPPPPPTDAKYKPLTITRDVTIYRDAISNGDPNLGNEDVNKQVLAAANKIDPITPRDKVPADAATVVVANAKRLGVAVIRVLAPDPLTKEKFRQFGNSVEQMTQAKELDELKVDNPFSLANLLKRHAYTSGERDIKTVEDLKSKDDKKGG